MVSKIKHKLNTLNRQVNEVPGLTEGDMPTIGKKKP